MALWIGRKPRSDGLTLVELLVVTTVFAVLAAILLPVLAGMRDRVRRTSCLSNLRQITLAHLVYLQDWDERFPDWRMLASPEPAPFGTLRFWPECFHPYLCSEALLRDPSAVWDGTEQGIRLADYTLLTWTGGFGTAEVPYFRWPGPPLSLGKVVRPTQTLTLIDGWTATSRTVVVRRHTGGMNAAFVDGHARWLAEGEYDRLETNGRGFYWMRYATADR